MRSFVIISGCSGGGKSTLLQALSALGYAVVEEPGRRIVKEELEINGNALPWIDMARFAERAVKMALQDLSEASTQSRLTFFDRGLVDAMAALNDATGAPISREIVDRYPFHREVFLTPPWPEIYQVDPERRHHFQHAVAEYQRLLIIYPELGFRIRVLPKLSVEERATFVLDRLQAGTGWNGAYGP